MYTFQIVCDAKLIIRNLVARWPGATHDSFMFGASAIHDELERGEFHGNWLLGDSGYPCRPYLMTPLLQANTRAEERYNRSHKATRTVVERCIGVLKSRFR